MKQAKFVETVNTMVDKSQWGEINSLPQKLDFHLTPMHPIDKGAKIEGAYGIGFVPPYAGASDGLYWLSGQQWYYRASEVALSVPTDKGELYVVDCRILESDYYGVTRQGTMGVWVPGIVDDEITAKDGHLVFAFKATKHRTWIELGYEDKEGDEWLFLAFWGCDIGKAS